jgi:hypothetical protein
VDNDTAPPVVQYADALTRYDIRCSEDGGVWTLRIPRRFAFARLGPTTLVAIGLAVVAVAGSAVMYDPNFVRPAASLLIYGALGFGIYRHLTKPITLTIDADCLTTDFVPPALSKEYGKVMSLPLKSIYSVHYNPSAGSIFIRSHQREMIELPMRFPPPTMTAVATLIRDRLKLPVAD